MNNNEKNKDGMCGMKMMSRTELLKQVKAAKLNLCEADTEESVKLTIDNLANLMNDLSKDSQFADVKGLISDITGTIHAVKRHDSTRYKLAEMLNELIKCLEAIIAEEKKKEHNEETDDISGCLALVMILPGPDAKTLALIKDIFLG